jgi:hypothetical protein
MPCTKSILPFAFALLAATSFAQGTNPADKQQPPAQEPALTPDDQISTTTVTAKRVSEYHEEDLVGPYEQPEWTTIRRFPSTRVYVRPPGTFAFEYWKRLDFARHGPTEVQTQYEFEVGLPGRFQVDMYINSTQAGSGGEGGMNGESVELRWALAEWGRIWGNPTLYVELANRDMEADVLEYKLLLGDQLADGWHWGTNFVFEHEMGGDIANTYELTAGVSKILTDERLSLGGELKTSLTDTSADRGTYEEELLVGPSLQYRPRRNIHLDVATLAGIGGDSPDAQAFFVLGYEF